MQALTDLLQRLVAIPSPNPPGDCRAVAEFCAGYLEGAGFAVTLVAPDDRAWSVVASIGPAEGPSLLYHAHIDTVPLGQNAHWTHDPFGGEVCRRQALWARQRRRQGPLGRDAAGGRPAGGRSATSSAAA